MTTDERGRRGRLTVEVSRSGGHHHARRETVSSLALEGGLLSGRTWYTPWINGKNTTGDGTARLHPAQLELSGTPPNWPRSAQPYPCYWTASNADGPS